MAGKCQPVVLATTIQTQQLAQDATYLYWVENHVTCDVMKVPKAGGPSVVLASGLDIGCGGDPGGIVVDDSYVYFTRPAANEIRKVPVGGGTIQLFVWAATATSLARDATRIYWVGGVTGAGFLLRRPLAGGMGEAESLYVSQNQPLGLLALDDTHVYTQTSMAGAFLRVPLAGGPSKTIATGAPGASTLAVDGSNIYWTQGSNPVEVRRAPKDGSGPPALIATLPGGSAAPHQTMVDATSLYVPASTNVWIVPLNGAPPVGVAPGANEAVAAIADEKYLYWAERHGNIYKVVR